MLTIKMFDAALQQHNWNWACSEDSQVRNPGYSREIELQLISRQSEDHSALWSAYSRARTQAQTLDPMQPGVREQIAAGLQAARVAAGVLSHEEAQVELTR